MLDAKMRSSVRTGGCKKKKKKYVFDNAFPILMLKSISKDATKKIRKIRLVCGRELAGGVITFRKMADAEFKWGETVKSVASGR